MLNLTGYKATELLYTGTRTLVYRAIRLSDEQPVITKVLRNPHPHFNELVGFRNQYVITQNLDSPFIVKPLALERYENGYALVMPDEGAVPLIEYWQESRGQGHELLPIAIQLAQTLHILSQERIIHKDIKPANILIHPETGQVQLIDFSIASLLPKEQQQFVNPKGLEGTLAYISPEQTGRMNRGIDYRTDFYSLGVTLYELLTRSLPFQKDNPMELLHCHIAQAPFNPSHLLDSQGLPHSSTLSAIILKLMAKNAEDRYQSALGLKHDLERCLQLLETTGEIANFELGGRDVCDRLLIPEKLYGRETEVQTLLNAFERVANGNSEMMLVAGFSGIGKTSVVNEVHKPIVEKHGYFIKGKYDQFNRNIPFSAFVPAFRDLMGQLLSESDEELANWKSNILKTVSEDGQVLIDVIPELERVIGKQPEATELSGTAAQNRFNFLFQKFIAVFTTPEHPLVLFLDDLQWADSASLSLIKVLMSESETGHLLLLGAYRDNEVFPAHPLMLMLGELEKERATISTITLAPLPIAEINNLVAETLNCTSELAQPLTELVYQKTQGNPFFTTQFLNGLYEDTLILFNANLGYWECDLVRVQDAALTNDVVEFMAGRLQKLPQATQDVLKLAACIGNQFDLETLAIVYEDSVGTVAEKLWGALREGLILPITEAYKFFQISTQEEEFSEDIVASYRFLHDRVQQAAYSLIPEEQKQSTHYHIGKLLLQKIPSENLEAQIFELVGQLNYGTSLITQEKERDQLTQLNLIACRKAKSATAYQAGLDYADVGLSLLGQNSWQERYTTTLEFHDLAAELAALCGNFEAMEQYIATAIEQAHVLLDRINVYRIQILANISRNRIAEAIDMGQQILAQLGIVFPENPCPEDVQVAIDEISQLIGDRAIADLVDLPIMTEAKKIATVQIASSLMGAAKISGSPLFPLLLCAAVKLSIQFGNTMDSAFAYVAYSIVSTHSQSLDTAFQFGQLALQVVSRLDAKVVKPKVLDVFGGYLVHRQSHLRESLPLFQEAYTVSLEVGDLEYAGYSAHDFCLNSFWCGQPLQSLEQETDAYRNALVQLNQLGAANCCSLDQQTILNLLTGTTHPNTLSGEIVQETELLPQLQDSDEEWALFLFYLYKLMLSYLFGDIVSAQVSSKAIQPYLPATEGAVVEAVFYFYDSLIALAVLELDVDVDVDVDNMEDTLQRVEQNQLTLQQNWVPNAPMNYQHKSDLVEAEKCRVLGEKIKAIELYDLAIAGAKENGYIQEEALANELAAKFYLNWGKEKIAATYMQEAYYGYTRWGAKAKINHLEANYPQLLTLSLQKQRVEFDSLDSLSSLTQTLTATLQSQTQSSTNVSDTLDFSAILQTAQKLSSTIELDTLLAEMSRIILTTAGVQKAVVLIPNEQQWQIRSTTSLTSDGTITTHTQCQPLSEESPVPIRLIHYVKNTLESVLIEEMQTEIVGIRAGYLLKYQPQSVWCVPLLNQGQLIAIAYLEHATTKGVFTSNRQTILEFLCAQAAVSLQNAQLYQQAQTSLTDLQQAQLQLVQSEKMSALGNLVAGVAHEINNPVGFLQGNIQPAQEYVQDLLGLIDFLLTKTPSNDLHIKDEIESMDLEFIREDLPKLIGSMNAGVDRIRSISDSLRTFSRKDRDNKTAFNIHDGIESTLLILKHRTKANEQRPQVEVIKNYGEFPNVKCFPGQLNQVFMNILANAIDAFDEANQGKSYQEIEENPNTITIATIALDQQVQVQIQDNGCGMKPETVERIFEQGFTTKEVGKGTGLGMAIAHQIIVEKHGGAIACHSQLGKGTEFTISLPAI